MIYGSVCSGIEAASVAWHPLGWKPAFFSEIDAFPRAVLKHHYPDIPLHGDFSTIEADHYAAIDVLVGGTPCQSFSIAGLRKGLADERGNLALEFCRLARRLGPRWIVWENVPGVLSLDGGRAFASILGGLAECGYGLAYRVLDAQFVRVDGFGRAVPQRRRRVFVVGYLGDWRRAAAVLFERQGLSWDSPPRRQAGQRPAPTLSARTKGGGGDKPHVLAFSAKDHGADTMVECSPTLRAGGFTTSHANAGVMPAIAFDARQSDVMQYGDKTGPLDTDGLTMGIMHGWLVRRLTPVECERLQGFPDGYTAIPYRGKPASDGPRYKALGNSMACNVMRWIGTRINQAEGLTP